MKFTDKLKECMSPYYKLQGDNVIRKGDMVEYENGSIVKILNEVWYGQKVGKQIEASNANRNNIRKVIVSILRNR